MSDEYGVIKDVNEIDGVGHRIVHGGEKINRIGYYYRRSC